MLIVSYRDILMSELISRREVEPKFGAFPGAPGCRYGDKSEALFLLDRGLNQRRTEEQPAG